jgi:hypothetical protein
LWEAIVLLLTTVTRKTSRLTKARLKMEEKDREIEEHLREIAVLEEDLAGDVV